MNRLVSSLSAAALRRAALGALLLGASACGAHGSTPSESAPIEYEQCGICFEAPLRLVPDEGQRVDSCVFRFHGSGMAVAGEHGAFAPTLQGDPDNVVMEERIVPGWGRQTRLRTRSGSYVRALRYDASAVFLPMYLAVEYADEDQDDVAEQIVLSARRCGIVKQ